MIIPDINILVHAYNTEFPQHAAARRWWEFALNSPRPTIGLPWVSILGFLRLVTSRVVFTRPFPASQAVAITRSWCQQDAVDILVPGEHHGDIFFRLIEEAGTAGNLTTDAHLAALALEYRAELATTDSDFSRFKGVHWFNPLTRVRG
jgi:uncharacterized protein